MSKAFNRLRPKLIYELRGTGILKWGHRKEEGSVEKLGLLCKSGSQAPRWRYGCANWHIDWVLSEMSRAINEFWQKLIDGFRGIGILKWERDEEKECKEARVVV